LIAGKLPNGTVVDGTILVYPFTAMGEVLPLQQRPNILARVSDIVGPISSSAFTVSETALNNCSKSDLMGRFIGAMYTASIILLDPSKKTCSIQAIQNQLNVTTNTALLEYAAAINPIYGEISPDRKFTVNQAGLNTIIAVREKFGGFASLPPTFNFSLATTPGTGNLIDYSIRDKVVASLNYELLNSVC
jgi:hypothetical protein